MSDSQQFPGAQGDGPASGPTPGTPGQPQQRPPLEATVARTDLPSGRGPGPQTPAPGQYAAAGPNAQGTQYPPQGGQQPQGAGPNAQGWPQYQTGPDGRPAAPMPQQGRPPSGPPTAPMPQQSGGSPNPSYPGGAQYPAQPGGYPNGPTGGPQYPGGPGGYPGGGPQYPSGGPGGSGYPGGPSGPGYPGGPSGPVPPEPPKKGKGGLIAVVSILAVVIIGAVIALVLLLTKNDTSATGQPAATHSSSPAKQTPSPSTSLPKPIATPSPTDAEAEPTDDYSRAPISGLTAGQSDLIDAFSLFGLTTEPASGFDSYWQSVSLTVPKTDEMKAQAQEVFNTLNSMCGGDSDCIIWIILDESANITDSTSSTLSGSITGSDFEYGDATFTFSMKSTGSDKWEFTSIKLTSP